MNNHTANHSPSSGSEHSTTGPLDADPAFVHRLEGELTSVLRHRVRFAQPASESKHRHLSWRIAALLTLACLTSMTLGAAGAIAVTAKPGGDYQLIRLRAEAAVRISDVTVQAARERLVHIAPLVEAGHASTQSLAEMQFGVEEAMAESQLRRLNLDEIDLRQDEIDDSITATTPLGRDFVTERLEIRLHQHQAQLGVLRERLSILDGAAQAGRGPIAEVHEAINDVQSAMAQVDLIRSLIDLRQRTVANELLHDQAELQAMQLHQRTEMMIAEYQLDSARARLVRIHQLADAAMTSQAELRIAEGDVEVATIEHQTLREQLAIIEQMIAERSKSDE